MTHRTTSWNTPYTFSGKEKDVETGYGYFGARYYDSGLSIWLSVDPMSDKYPSMSPYNYCANNPVILVDPDGQKWVTPSDIQIYNQLVQSAQNDINNNNSIILDIETSAKNENRRLTRSEKNNISNLKSQNEYLQFGIDGLKNMDKDSRYFTFNDVGGSRGSVSIINNTFSINYFGTENGKLTDVALGNAWHEAIHLSRALAEGFATYFFDNLNGMQLSNDDLYCYEEEYAYTSQFYFKPQSMPKLKDPVTNIFSKQIFNIEDIIMHIRSSYIKCTDY